MAPTAESPGAVRLSMPTFFVIGAAKCGTTSLHHYLAQHPDIAMTAVKEPQVFSDHEYRARMRRYEELFLDVADVRGESSAVYSQFPRWPDVPERIAEQLPQSRFIYLVGDPVERAIAHYAQRILDGNETRPLASAMADADRIDSLYVCASRYATQIRRYLGCFDRAALLVVDQADLLRHRRETLSRIFGFLGVDPEFRSPEFEVELNRRRDYTAPRAMWSRLRGAPGLRRLRTLPVSLSSRRRMRRMLARRIEVPEADGVTRRRLADALREEVEWLRGFTRGNFSNWSV